jgi:cytoskeleton protein RodZ
MTGQPAALPAAQVKPPVPANTVAPAISATPATVIPAVANAAAQSIQFRFMQPAWLQVRDSTGKLVHSALNPAGAAIEVSGTPPFSLVIGNASNVQVAYKNKPVDIKPYIDVTVARFTLN